MKNLGYYNGKYDLIENMSVPMNDRACYFGDGIFEVIYTRNHKPYALDEHIDRLYARYNERSHDGFTYFLSFVDEEIAAIREMDWFKDKPDYNYV